MNKYSIALLILILSTLLNACNEKTSRIVVGWSSMGDLVMRNDSVEVGSIRKGLKNGDIVIANYRYDILKKRRVNSVYRIIASPGDIVKIDSIATYVNGNIVLQRYSIHTNLYVDLDSSLSKLASKINKIEFKMPKENESLPDSFPLPLVGTFTLKNHIINTKYYFLLNDDYSDIHDSRYFGLMPVDSIVGVVKKIYHKR